MDLFLAALAIAVFTTIVLLHHFFDISHYFIRFRHRILTVIFYFKKTDTRPVSAAYKAFEYLYNTYRPDFPLSSTAHRSELERLRRETTFHPFLQVHQRCHIEKHVHLFENRSITTYWISSTIPRHEEFLKQPFLLYLHGGAYVLGDIQGYMGFESQFSNRLGLPICHIEYGLGPENPLPNALEDVLAVYQSFLSKDASVASRIILMGDSAGGGLALLLTQALIRLHIQPPVAVVLISPWSDLSASGKGCDLTAVNERLELVRTLRKQAFGGVHEPSEQQIKAFSPLFGSFVGFPRLYIATGQQHRLNDDSVRLATRLMEQGVDVAFDEGKHLMHIFPVFFQYYPEGQRSMDKICRWIHQQLASTKQERMQS